MKPIFTNHIKRTSVSIAILFITHRTAGPAYRLCQILKKIGEGDLAQAIHFCKGDEFREVELAASEMNAALQKRIRDLKSLSSELTLRLENIASADERPKVRTLQRNMEELNKLLATFRLP